MKNVYIIWQEYKSSCILYILFILKFAIKM
jgi:hypothetical protein